MKASVSTAGIKNCQYLQIAAVTVAIYHDNTIDFHNADPSYSTFFEDKGTDKNSNIAVRLVAGKMPDLNRLQKSFDTHESWSMYGDAKGYWIYFHPDLHPDPFWIARFDRRANRAVVYCGSPLRLPDEGNNKYSNPFCYPLDQLLFMYYLAYRNGILVHAAGIDLVGRGLIFPGCSGAGKSTLARLFADSLVGNLLSDERVVIRQNGAGWDVFGTPWAGTGDIANNSCAPLAGMFFLKHGERNDLRELTAANALERLLPVLSIPWYDQEVMARIVAFAKHLAARVPAYELTFKPDRSAVDFLVKSLPDFIRRNYFK